MGLVISRATQFIFDGLELIEEKETIPFLLDSASYARVVARKLVTSTEMFSKRFIGTSLA